MLAENDMPITQDVVFIGGGHAHAIAMHMLAMRALPGVRLTLISSFVQTPYSGMLPGLIAGNYTYDDVHIDLGVLCRRLGIRFIEDTVTGLDLETKTISCQEHPAFSYDLLSIDTGSSPDLSAIAGAKEFSVGVKPVDVFLSYWERLRQKLLSDSSSEPLSIGVVGAGASGVEVALAMQHRLKTDFHALGRSAEHIKFHIVSATSQVLPSHNEKVQRVYQQVLDQRKVTVLPQFRVSRFEKGVLIDEQTSQRIDLDEIIWAISASAPQWPKNSGLACSPKGFISVNASLQSISHPMVFAAGDIADVEGYPRPKAGVFAVRQGPPLAKNLENALNGRALKPFKPQTKFLSLVSTGDRYAVASRGDWVLSGAWVWRWKDAIDRKFMRRFSELKTAVNSAKEHSNSDDLMTMRCGGCGAKVGQPILNRVINQLSTRYADKTEIALAQADDAAVMKIPADKLLVQSVDAFRRFIDDDFIFAQIAANHALGDVFAMGATPHSAQALVTLPFASEEKVEQQLLHLMLGASKVFDECKIPIVGGHTAEGAELSLGFTVNGLVDEKQLLKKSGLQVGDKLILTKALGTGTLFAADMRGQAQGRWVKSAIDHMLVSNKAASELLFSYQVSACTDVTGFGLAGHLIEMLQASKMKAQLDMNELPLLAGASTCLARGLFSSLHEQNKQIEAKLSAFVQVSEGCERDILFDPQTAGGLLAGVPEAMAEQCLKGLHERGYPEARIIGSIV